MVMSLVNPQLTEVVNQIITIIVEAASIFHSIAYQVHLELEDLVYYPLLNRQSPPNQLSFPPKRNQRINELSEADANELTGFSKQQLRRLLRQLRMSQIMHTPTRERFHGEEVLIMFLYHLKHGHTYLHMSRRVFGDDPRRYSGLMRAAVDHLYDTFYHKISGDLMRMWLPNIQDFRNAICERLMSGAIAEEVSYDGRLSQREYILTFLDPMTFCIFGFIDNYGVPSCWPHGWIQGFIHDIQATCILLGIFSLPRT